MVLKGARQFSYLILEENEEYIADVSCNCRSDIQRRIFGNTFKGRVRIGSKSMIIEPDDSTISMIKVLFSQVSELSITSGGSSMVLFPKVVRLVNVQVIDGKSRSTTPNKVLSNRSPGSKETFELEVSISSEIGPQIISICCELWEAHSQKLGQNKIEGLVGKWIGLLYNKEIMNVEYEFLLDHRDRFLISKPLIVNRIKPFTKHRGILHIVSSGICFKPLPNFSNKPFKKIPLKNVWFIFKRIYSMKPNSMEIIYGKESKPHSVSSAGTSCWRSLFLEFQSSQDREHIVSFLQSYLMALNNKGCQWSSQTPHYSSCQCSVPGSSSCLPMLFVDPLYAGQSPCFKKHVQNLWIHGSISTYHYLDYLNSIGGRSRGDLTQYPIFPWTLVNFESDPESELDLAHTSNFRDLSKPLGAINEGNLEMLKGRMKDLPSFEKFLYGSHYSTPGYISYFLVRQFPEYQLKLHGGDFDVWNRMFHSMNDTWKTILEGKTTYMELIPQFYEQNPDFLLNSKLNIRTNCGSLLNVQIPNWQLRDQEFSRFLSDPETSSQAKLFLKVLRYALESQTVNKQIHEWIDLIFGYKQRGTQALNSDNLFHPITYINSSIALHSDFSPVYASQETSSEIAMEPSTKKFLEGDQDPAIKAQVEEFGQVPIKLFNDPHPKRNYSSLEESNIKRFLDHEHANLPWFVLFRNNPQFIEAEYDFLLKEEARAETAIEDIPIHQRLSPVQEDSHGFKALSNPMLRESPTKRVSSSQESLSKPDNALLDREKVHLGQREGFMLVLGKEIGKDPVSFETLDLSKVEKIENLSREKLKLGKKTRTHVSVQEKKGEFVLLAILWEEEEQIMVFICTDGNERDGFRCIYSDSLDLQGNKATCIDLNIFGNDSIYIIVGTLSGDIIYTRLRLLRNDTWSPTLQKSQFVLVKKEKTVKQNNMDEIKLVKSIDSRKNFHFVSVSQGGTMLLGKLSQNDDGKSAWFPMVDIPLRDENVVFIAEAEFVPSDLQDRQAHQNGAFSRFGKITKEIDSYGITLSCVLSEKDGPRRRLWSLGGGSSLISIDLLGMLGSTFSTQSGGRKSGKFNAENRNGSNKQPHALSLEEVEESLEVEWITISEKSILLYAGLNWKKNFSILVFWDLNNKQNATVLKIIHIPGLLIDSICWDQFRKGLVILGGQASSPDSGNNLPVNLYFLREESWEAEGSVLQILTLKSSLELLLNITKRKTSNQDHNLPELKRHKLTCTEKLLIISSPALLLTFRFLQKPQGHESSVETSPNHLSSSHSPPRYGIS
ncbi:BEACH domain containing protein [Cryptosporidium felis]|nr:BEACH domain containing protein [Cryptosporidium felis]